MRNILTLLALLAFAAASSAQNIPDTDNSEYSDKYSKLYRSYVKDPENVANNLAMALFYSDSLNPMCNYATAMNFISAAEEHYIAIVEDRDKYKEVSRLIKKKITVVLVRQTKYNIISQARQYLDSQQNISDATLDTYAQAFKNDPVTTRMVESKRIELRYQKTVEANTLAAYKIFLDNYSATFEGEDATKRAESLASSIVANAQTEGQVDSLLTGYLDMAPVKNASLRKKSSLAYAKLLENPTPQACRSFLSRYPGSDEYTIVLNRMESLVQDKFSDLSSPRQIADFALENPDSPMAEKALETLKRLITEERNMQALHIYLQEFHLDIDYNDIYLLYYQWHTEEGNRSPLALFEENNPDFPFNIALQEALTAAERYDSININIPFNEKDFREWASKIYHLTGKKESFVALQRTMQRYIAAKDWRNIQPRIDFFSICFEDNCVDEVAEFTSIINRPTNEKIVYSPIVRPAYDMMHPVMHPDGKMLLYNRMENGKLVIQSAMLTPTKSGAIWKGAGNVHFTNIDNSGLSVFNLFDNGNKMLIGAEGDILVAESDSNGWTVTEVLPAPINSEYNDFDAFMMPDGSGILFASDRPGGQNLQPSHSYFHGDTALASDIYFVPKTASGWGDAVNLGINVNSPYMECSPMVSNDMKTVYFVTDGRGGLGYADIYHTTRDDIGDWTHWTTPVNYGKEVNSGFNEISVTPAADGNKLIVCSNAHGRYGCYSATAFHTIDDRFSTVTIKPDEVGISIDIAELSSQKFVVSHQPVNAGSTWQSSFYSDKQYLLFSKCNGLFLPAMLFKPSAGKVLSPAVYDKANLVEMSKSGHTLTLPGIQFDDRKSTLKTFSLTEIDHLVQFLGSNPDLDIEFIIHTDGHDDTFCFNLSQARGQEIKKALTSKGINNDRIIISAYGNSQTKTGFAKPSVGVLFHTY